MAEQPGNPRATEVGLGNNGPARELGGGPGGLGGPGGAGGRRISIAVPEAQPRLRKNNGSSGASGGASLFSSTANLANTIIGTGMVALPHAVSYTGWALGLVLIAFCGLTGASGLYLLTRCANKMGGRRQSFFSVAMRTIPKGARWFDLAIALKCYGVSISYLIISGQLMPQVVLSFLKAAGHEHSAVPALLLDRDFWVTFFLVLLLPVCFLRKLDSLRHASYLSMGAVLYLVIIVFYYFLSPNARATLPPRGEVHWIVLSPHILPIFPVFVFAFTCAQNMLPVYNELSATDPLMHMERAKYAIGFSIGGAGLVYTAVSILGYLEFGSNIGDNIIAEYPASSLFVAFGRLSIVLLTMAAFPLQVHPCRAAINKFIYPPRVPGGIELPVGNDTIHEEDEDNEEDEADREQAVLDELLRNSRSSLTSDSGHDTDEIPLLRWVVTTAIILSTSFTVALLVDDLSIILGFVGSLGSTTISFILPGILYSSLHADEPGNRLRRPAQVLAAWGFVVLIVALSANILKLINTGVAVGEDVRADRLAALVSRY